MALFKIQNLKNKSTVRWVVEILILAVLLWLFFILAGRALCHIALAQIAELINTKIKTESVSFRTNGSVLIKDLVVRPNEKDNDGDVILEAQTVYARFSLSSLFLLRPRLKVIDVNDFVFNAKYEMDTDSWNLSALTIKPPEGTSGKMPRIYLEGGTLQYSKLSKGKEEVAVSIPLKAKFDFDEQTQNGYSFEITTAAMLRGYGKSRLTGFWKPGMITLAGGISSVDVPDLEMAWVIEVLAAELKYDKDKDFSLKLRIKDLHSKRSPALGKLAMVGPQFLEKSSPFAALQKFFDLYRPYGQIDLTLDASGNLKRLNESALSGEVYCKDVSFCYSKFPYKIEHLAGRIDFTKNSFTLKNLRGKHDDVELLFNGWSRDFGSDWKYQIQVASDNVALDNDLYSVLNTKQKESWSVFSPTGVAAVKYQFDKNSETDEKEKIIVEPRNAEAKYRRFPYPLKNITGRLLFEHDNIIFSDVVSQVDECKITLNGEYVTENADNSRYDILVDVNNLPLDSTLEQSLPEVQKDLYDQIRPAGLADGRIKIAGKNSEPADFTADMVFKKASFKSDRFSLPVSDVSGNAVFTPDLITVKDFTGKYEDGLMSLTGQIWPNSKGRQSQYRLSMNFEQVRFNDDLFDFVPESLKKIVTELKPQGKLNLVVDLNKDTDSAQPDYKITMNCLGDSANFPQLPYPLRDITGTMLISKDNIIFKDMAATLDEQMLSAEKPSTIQVNGEITFNENSFSDAVLNLSANDIFFNECFVTCLPQHIQPIYNEISPAGRFDLNFRNVRVLTTDDGKKSFDFNGDIRFKDCSFGLSDAEAELDAVLAIEGLYNTTEGLTNCLAAFNGGTLKIFGKSFTNLKADILYDPDLRLWSTKDLIADYYGGKSVGKFEFKQLAGKASEYLLEVVFDNIDIQEFLLDRENVELGEDRYTTGKMDGSLSISARVGDTSSRVGACRLTIRDMQVGRLSPLAKLLQVLKLTEPKDYAFDQMFVDSYIRRNDLLVKKLDLSGQAVAFYGSGLMNLKTRDVDLDLTARGRRLATDDPSVLQSLTEGLGRAVIKMEVTGDFYDPDVKTKTLPVLGETLKMLGSRRETR
ncbi:MAG: hypothetical protein JW837_00945 [Sedimentisphaerales bacterium]|nr:hypothetical protein [Sedimentisphaerales bacterium]